MNASPKKLTAADVTFELVWEPEYAAPEDSFERPEDVQWVKAQLAQGNDWAWFCAKVVARWEGFEGVDYLGACSYDSEKDFTAPGGYFDDMKQVALDDLNRTITETATKLAPLF